MLLGAHTKAPVGASRRLQRDAPVAAPAALQQGPARTQQLGFAPVAPSPLCGAQQQLRRPRRWTAAAAATAVAPSQAAHEIKETLPGFSVLIAGAGISGLTLALGLLKKGVKVQVLERDLTAVRGEGKLRGPIQVQSNALAALEAIDEETAEEIMRHGCITGDRINGLCDGVSGDWYCKFDTFHPAVDRGLPVTRVISRITLQEVLADAVMKYGGPDVIQGGCHVVSYEEYKDAAGNKRVTAELEDGRRFDADMLVGTDGIWSKIRKQMLGETPAHYSEYTCYTGISDYVPADIDLVGYRVFLGNGQYFVSSDVGEGKMQWYAFHQEPAGGEDAPGSRKARLLELFGHWNYNVVDLIKATPEQDVLRRDIYDRPPVFQWAEGRVALMGDSAHAMQPNLGQGGCMAIEDAYELANDLGSAVAKAAAANKPAVDVEGALKKYTRQRMMRVSAIHGMAGMAAFMASTYKAYLGEGMGPLSWITDYHIHHPGRVGGQFILKFTMPAVLSWVLGGNVHQLEAARAPHCFINDKPRHFKESEFELFMRDDDALWARAGADWLLVAERVASSAAAALTSGGSSMGGAHMAMAAPVMALAVSSEAEAPMLAASSGGAATAVMTAPVAPPSSTASTTTASIPSSSSRSTRYGLPPFEYKGAYMNLAPADAATGHPTVVIGSAGSCHVVAEGSGIASHHAVVEQLAQGRFQLRDCGSAGGTYVNAHRMERGSTRIIHPGDIIEFGQHPAKEVYKVKLQHPSYRTSEVQGNQYKRMNTGAMSNVV